MSTSERIRPKLNNTYQSFDSQQSDTNTTDTNTTNTCYISQWEHADEQIKHMTTQIKELKALRLQSDFRNKYSERNRPKISPSTSSRRKRNSKRRLYHPNLDSVYVGVAHSPYLTDPGKQYSKDTIRTSNALRQLNLSGQELKTISDLPFDLQKSKSAFVEALTYAPKFEVRL